MVANSRDQFPHLLYKVSAKKLKKMKKTLYNSEYMIYSMYIDNKQTTNNEKGKLKMKMKKLANNQTVVEKEFETAVFFSYETEIAGLKWNNEKYGWELDYVTSAWDYSRTTTRYVYAFLREYNIRFETKDGVKYGSEAVGKELKKVVSEIVDANGEKEVEVQR